MSILATKQSILDGAGYFYHFDRKLYANRRTKKAFSIEFVDDHSESELERFVQEETDGSWHFYFNSPPAEAVKRELESVLG